MVREPWLGLTKSCNRLVAGSSLDLLRRDSQHRPRHSVGLTIRRIVRRHPRADRGKTALKSSSSLSDFLVGLFPCGQCGPRLRVASSFHVLFQLRQGLVKIVRDLDQPLGAAGVQIAWPVRIDRCLVLNRQGEGLPLVVSNRHRLPASAAERSSDSRCCASAMVS
jgi:hypothetical protein